MKAPVYRLCFIDAITDNEQGLKRGRAAQRREIRKTTVFRPNSLRDDIIDVK
ncbi:hypothetical protein HMPREF1618_03120 [Escherichia coli 908691]|nr:hypothetical protein HMPREF1618_03120 [Escherichia coli 908691]